MAANSMDISQAAEQVRIEGRVPHTGPQFAFLAAALVNEKGVPTVLAAPKTAARVLMVEPNTGDDGQGSRGQYGKPFATLAAAKAAAVSGDTIVVYPGSYSVTQSIAKDGVNWHFMAGATVTFSDYSDTAIFDDGNTAMTFAVTGAGNFTRTHAAIADDDSTIKFVWLRHASSNVSIECGDITVDTSSLEESEAKAVVVDDGTLRLRARKITAAGNLIAGQADAIWWVNGEVHIEVESIAATNYGVYSDVDTGGTPTGELFVRANEIAGLVAIYTAGSSALAKLWVSALRITGTASSVAGFGAERLYVTAQKLEGQLNPKGGLFYVTAEKLSAVANGTGAAPNLLLVDGASADARISVQHWDRGSYTGETIKVTAGAVEIQGGKLVCGTAKGIEVTGGTLECRDFVVDTSGSASQNPVLKSGGTLRMQNCRLVAEGTRDSIEAGTAQTVSLMGCWTNKAVDANVTNNITGGLDVDADVA